MSRYGERTRIGEPISNFGKPSEAGVGYGVATGGTALASPPSGFSGMEFLSDGTLSVTKAGLFDTLLVGGGGGGGGAFFKQGDCGAGGGGGDIVGIDSVTTIFLAVGTYSVTVGAGGAGANGFGGVGNGFASKLSGFGAAGGGGGGSSSASTTSLNDPEYLPVKKGNSGASSGGWAVSAPGSALKCGVKGNNGGVASGVITVASNNAGGGGGAGSAGGNGSGTTGGGGGNGVEINGFTGGASNFVCAGGGGAGSTTGGTAGTGGVAGRSGNVVGIPAVNRGAGGGGGGGSGNANSGGAGQAGAVYVRFTV